MVGESFVDDIPRDPENILPPTGRAPRQPGSTASKDIARILALLRSGTSHDFSQYKKSSNLRGIEARMTLCGAATRQFYAGYLERHPEELQPLLEALLVGVTSFFRDPQAFRALRQDALPELIATRPQGSVLRAWVPGCATGEEAYSLALLLQEAAEETAHTLACRIFATDIDEQALAIARAGTYPRSIDQDVSPSRLKRLFLPDQQGFKIEPRSRATVVFALQNVVTHAPFIKVDLISCRNLLIYLEPDLQDALITSFYHALRPGGILFLSPSESIGSNTSLFTPISRKWKLYRANSLCLAAASSSPVLALSLGNPS